jgi:hypothetical protein
LDETNYQSDIHFSLKQRGGVGGKRRVEGDKERKDQTHERYYV